MKSKKKPEMSFRQAVEATSDIETGYLPGLTALGVHSKRVVVSDTTKIQGSVDINDCTIALYPNI